MYNMLPKFLLLLTAPTFVFGQNLRKLHPDTGLNITELVAKYGYPIESHEVQTEDGYLLTMHRIPHGIHDQSTGNSHKPAVLLMHGLLSCSDNWVDIGPSKGLGFLLADAGFDVWLGNQRGNTWSRKHNELNPDISPGPFFNFSFHEIGYYDLPAKIDYILNVTEQSQLSYVGHSQGTTSFFVMASERPEYNDKIRFMTALAPVAHMDHFPNPFLRTLGKNYLELIQLTVSVLKFEEFLPHYEAITILGSTVCADGSVFQELCANFLFFLGGFDSPQLERNHISVVLTNTPAGSSTKQVIHYLQEINSTNFCKFDYGPHGNLMEYGYEYPPKYNLSKINAPVALHYGLNDYLTSPIDVERLAKDLPNVVKSKEVPWKEFSHLDFLWAKDIVELINREVVKELLDNLL